MYNTCAMPMFTVQLPVQLGYLLIQYTKYECVHIYGRFVLHVQYLYCTSTVQVLYLYENTSAHMEITVLVIE